MIMGRTDGRTDGRSDPTPRTAFAFGDAGKNSGHLSLVEISEHYHKSL